MRDVIVSNIKESRKIIKNIPEEFRVLKGILLQKLGLVDYKLYAIGEEISYAKRFYSENEVGLVEIITPPNSHCMTTFFDVEPISPSGKYICVTKVPFINRIPVPGDWAQVCIIDLEKDTIKAIYNTKGWGAQLGANVQWIDDDTIVCNDEISGKGVGIKVNIHSCEATILNGPIYGLTPCKNFSFSGDLSLINAMIPGYGIPESMINKKRQKIESSKDEGIWKTNLIDGRTELFMSINDILNSLPEDSPFKNAKTYIFNVKVNSKGDKLFVVMFAKSVPYRIGRTLQLVTIDLKTKAVNLSLSEEIWGKGGHHPNWMRNTDDIVMNLKLGTKKMKFVKFPSSGGDIGIVAPGVLGGGHPSISLDGRFLLTDSYTSEGFMDAEGKVPIRLIDLETNSEIELCRVYTNKLEGPRRVDPHPVWSFNDNYIVFNAVIGGARQVMLFKFKGKK